MSEPGSKDTGRGWASVETESMPSPDPLPIQFYLDRLQEELDTLGKQCQELEKSLTLIMLPERPQNLTPHQSLPDMIDPLSAVIVGYTEKARDIGIYIDRIRSRINLSK